MRNDVRSPSGGPAEQSAILAESIGSDGTASTRPRETDGIAPTMTRLEFRLTGEFIALNDLLKVTGVCASGGAGKALVATGAVAGRRCRGNAQDLQDPARPDGGGGRRHDPRASRRTAQRDADGAESDDLQGRAASRRHGSQLLRRPCADDRAAPVRDRRADDAPRPRVRAPRRPGPGVRQGTVHRRRARPLAARPHRRDRTCGSTSASPTRSSCAAPADARARSSSTRTAAAWTCGGIAPGTRSNGRAICAWRACRSRPASISRGSRSARCSCNARSRKATSGWATGTATVEVVLTTAGGPAPQGSP